LTFWGLGAISGTKTAQAKIKNTRHIRQFCLAAAPMAVILVSEMLAKLTAELWMKKTFSDKVVFK